ncbi:hypothetical protein M433DRAFT_154042 [Acidomyces richmondensis BFW]|nr:MAG: hypothetical protein FE78DRAFT_89917 [Acidomyces sp. 'richmondensis']KYG45869.1 hypothetical protein M433DRAFT_154042 [Acidomyces richmondensis BFW]
MARAVGGSNPLDFLDGYDLEQFVTRPEIRAPRYMVAKHHPEAISPGYWFVTPYSHFDDQPRTSRREHIPCQTGAHIYDGDGNLVWSGACMYGNRNIFGFMPVDLNGVQHLSFHLPHEVLREDLPMREKVAAGVLLNNQYIEVSRTVLKERRALDFHEFNIQPGGQSVLLSTTWDAKRSAPEIGQGERRLYVYGFQEIDLNTGAVTFDWDPLAHDVLLNESCDAKGLSKHANTRSWDFFHINSVDKNKQGDYLVSSRHTSTVYKISGQDGHIIWRLGGYRPDFEMGDGVDFHWQHHARFRFENETHTIISVFDNSGDDEDRNPNIPQARSSAKFIILNTASDPMTAKILRRFDRPDGSRSPKLGSVQMIGDHANNASVFVDWAIEGYISEYDGQGRLVLEARFQTERMSSYRAFKYPFIGNPTEAPALKIIPIPHSEYKIATAFYASWNGATEVDTWAFYGAEAETGPFRLLGSVKKHGFETSWVMPGQVRVAYAEAIDVYGSSLRKSSIATLVPAPNGDYMISTPSLDDLTWVNGSEYASDYVTKESINQKSTSKTEPRQNPHYFQSALFLVVYGFAAWGIFTCLRNIVQEITRRRKGYRMLFSFSNT